MLAVFLEISCLFFPTLGKVCDNPILKSHRTRLKYVFSGIGGSTTTNYEQASFYRNGWCASENARSAYLLITLPKQYHIEQVATFGDKDQTRWGRSYSLKYSHDATLVDKSREILVFDRESTLLNKNELKLTRNLLKTTKDILLKKNLLFGLPCCCYCRYSNTELH